jgi:tyrosyl-tRNA synthetase
VRPACSARDLLADLDHVPSVDVEFAPEGVPIARLVVESGLETSSSAAMRLIRGGGLYLNEVRMSDERARITADQAIDGKVFVLRKGKRDRRVVRVKHI